MTNESTEPAWSGYEQDIPVAQRSVQPAHNGSVDGSNPSGGTKYKRVALNNHYLLIGGAAPLGRISTVQETQRDRGWNDCIDYLKHKYGDLYVEVK